MPGRGGAEHRAPEDRLRAEPRHEVGVDAPDDHDAERIEPEHPCELLRGQLEVIDVHEGCARDIGEDTRLDQVRGNGVAQVAPVGEQAQPELRAERR